MRRMLGGLAAISALAAPFAVHAQATTRPCGAAEESGPACLLVHKQITSLPGSELYWHLDRFPSRTAASAVGISTSVVIEAFGYTWLFTVARQGWRARNGQHVAKIGPLRVAPASTYTAEYLRSVFIPGATAPLHVHSGPEAFFAVNGDTCLETPDGVSVGRGPGNSLMVKAGRPMLLMAIGKVPRQGFALILHDASQPATTLSQAWKPQGLCAANWAADQAR